MLNKDKITIPDYEVLGFGKFNHVLITRKTADESTTFNNDITWAPARVVLYRPTGTSARRAEGTILDSVVIPQIPQEGIIRHGCI